MRIDFKTVPAIIQTNQMELQKQLLDAQIINPDHTQDIIINNMILTLELNYNTSKWQCKEYKIH